MILASLCKARVDNCSFPLVLWFLQKYYMLKSTIQKYVTTNMCESLLEVIPESDLLLGKRNIQTLIILFLVGPRQKADTARNTVSKWIGNHTKVMWKLHTFPSTLQCFIHVNNITYLVRILKSNSTYPPFFPSLVCV